MGAVRANPGEFRFAFLLRSKIIIVHFVRIFTLLPNQIQTSHSFRRVPFDATVAEFTRSILFAFTPTKTTWPVIFVPLTTLFSWTYSWFT